MNFWFMNPPSVEPHVQLSNSFEAFLAAALIKVCLYIYINIYVYMYVYIYI